MSIELAPTNSYGLVLQSPLMVASGCLGYGTDRIHQSYLDQLGALVTPTTYLRRRGQPPKLIELPGGILVTGSWPGRSIDIVLSRYAPIWADWRTPVLLSLTGADPQSAAELAALLEGVEGLAGIELDCADCISTVAVGAVVKAVRVATFLPLLVKLPAQAADIAALAQSAAESGADALVISAPPRGQWQDQTGLPIGGWLCGPAQHPAALARVSQVVEAIDIPVIGSGGIVDAAGVDRMLAAGARAVQIGSALLADPGLAMRLAAAYQSS